MTRQYALEEIKEIVTQKLALALKKKPADLPQDVRMEELGVDSLALIGMVGEVEEIFDIELDDAGIRGSHTLANVAEAIEAKLG
jgi:acyl carrier protein